MFADTDPFLVYSGALSYLFLLFFGAFWGRGVKVGIGRLNEYEVTVHVGQEDNGGRVSSNVTIT